MGEPGTRLEHLFPAWRPTEGVASAALQVRQGCIPVAMRLVFKCCCTGMAPLL